MNIKGILEVVREIPPDHTPPKDPRQDRLTDLLAIFAIFGLALWFKILVRVWFYGNFFDFFYVNFSNPSTYWLATLLGVDPNTSIPSEGYGDYGSYYIPYVNAFTNGWNPYSGSIEPNDNINGYVYGPFYILFISLGKILFHLPTTDSIILSNLIMDALSSVLVYILAKRVTGNVFAFIFANVNSIAPVALYYANIKVLNTPQMTFLTLLFVWLYLEHHDNSAFFVLVLAILTKQFPLILAMPVLLWMARRYGWVKAIAFFVSGIFWFLALSIPYILWDPKSYIVRLFMAGGAKHSILTYSDAASSSNNGVAPNLNWSSYASKTSVLDNILLFLFGMNLDQFSFILVNTHLLWILTLVILAFPAWASYRKMEADTVLYYRFFAAYLIMGHATIARGIYKYYDAYLLPFMLLALLPRTQSFGIHIRLGNMLNRAIRTLFDPKYRQQEATVEYWVLFTATLALFTGIGYILSWCISLFLPTGGWRTLWLIVALILAVIFIVKPSPENKNTLFLQKSEVDWEKSNSLTVAEYSLSLIAIIGITVAVFAIVYFQFFDSFSVLLNSYSFVIFASLIGLPYLYQAINASIKEFIVVILLSIPFSFVGQYDFVLFGIAIGNTINIIVSLLLASTLFAVGKWIYMIYQQQTSLTQYLQSPMQITWRTNKIVLAFIALALLFVLEQFAILFFTTHVELFSWFIIILDIFLVLVINFADFENAVRKSSSFNWYIFKPTILVLQLSYSAFALFVFWKINVFILLTERLNGPSTVFAIGILFMGLLGYEFWHSLPQYLKSIAQTYKKINDK